MKRIAQTGLVVSADFGEVEARQYLERGVGELTVKNFFNGRRHSVELSLEEMAALREALLALCEEEAVRSAVFRLESPGACLSVRFAREGDPGLDGALVSIVETAVDATVFVGKRELGSLARAFAPWVW